MRINSKNKDSDRFYLNITFCNESEEREFLRNLIGSFEGTLSINCMLTDLDTVYPMYKEYFPRGNYYVFDRLTSASIFAFELNHLEVEDVISNWGYYTFDAMFALGIFKSELIKRKIDCMHELKCMPIVITQILDYSLHIALDHYYFKKISKLLVVN